MEFPCFFSTFDEYVAIMTLIVPIQLLLVVDAEAYALHIVG